MDATDRSSILVRFPLEIWALISLHTSADDVQHLMGTCRPLYNILKSDLIWAPKVHQKCVDIINMEKSTYYEFYRFQRHHDLQINRFIDTVTDLTESEIANTICSILDHKQLYISELVRICNHLNSSSRDYNLGFTLKAWKIHSETRLNSLRRIYISSQLIEAIRLCDVFYTIYEHLICKEAPKNTEQLLLKLNMVDPSWYEFIECRTRVINKAASMFQDQESPPQEPLFRKIHRLFRILVRCLDVEAAPLNPQSVFSNSGPDCLEDLLLLRCYGGDSRGTPLILASMVQNLCEIVGLPTKQFRHYVHVKDDTHAESSGLLMFDRSGSVNFLQTQNNVFDDKDPSLSWITDQFLCLSTPSRVHDFHKNPTVLHPTVQQGYGNCLFVRKSHQDHLKFYQGQILGTSYVTPLVVAIMREFRRVCVSKDEINVSSFDWFVSLVLDYKLPFLGLMLAHLFKDKPEMKNLTLALEKKIHDEGISLGPKERLFKINDTILLQPSDGQIPGTITYAKTKRVHVIIIGSMPDSHCLACFGLDSFAYIIHPNNLDNSTQVTDDLVLKFAVFDQLGAWFSHFDWNLRRFVPLNQS